MKCYRRLFFNTSKETGGAPSIFKNSAATVLYFREVSADLDAGRMASFVYEYGRFRVTETEIIGVSPQTAENGRTTRSSLPHICTGSPEQRQ